MILNVTAVPITSYKDGICNFIRHLEFDTCSYFRERLLKKKLAIHIWRRLEASTVNCPQAHVPSFCSLLTFGDFSLFFTQILYQALSYHRVLSYETEASCITLKTMYKCFVCLWYCPDDTGDSGVPTVNEEKWYKKIEKSNCSEMCGNWAGHAYSANSLVNKVLWYILH